MRSYSMRTLWPILLLFLSQFVFAQLVIEEIEPLEDNDPRIRDKSPRTNLSIE